MQIIMNYSLILFLEFLRKHLEILSILSVKTAIQAFPLHRSWMLDLLGVFSHRFNLAVQDILKDSSNCITKVQSLMKKLSYPIASAKLEKATRLRAVTLNVTRWASTACMLQMYLRIKPDLQKVDIEDLVLRISLCQEHEEIEKLCQRLQRLDDVTKTIQYESCTISDARSLFDCALEGYPNVSDRLSTSDPIICCPDFETGICKILEGDMYGISRKKWNPGNV